MNRKITLLSLKCLVLIGFTQLATAQQIYSNGGLSTGTTSASGVAAPSGYTWSEVQSEAGNTTESNTNFGFGGIFNNANTANLQLADDFVVPAGEEWSATNFEFFCYQTNYAGTTIPIDQLRVQIFSSDPSVAGAVSVAGDMTTNVLDLANSGEAFMYRTGNSVTPAPGTAPGTTRKLWRVRGNLNCTLTAGTYWVVYQVHATNDTNIFFPAVTIVGTRGLATWNAKQNTVVGAVVGWVDVVDGGNPAAAPDFPQDMPFVINGTILSTNKNDFDALVTLSPNPVKDMLTYSVPSNIVVKSAAIYDLNGKLVKEINGGSNEVNVSQLSVGNYILKLTSDTGVTSKKFIKE